MGVEIVCNTKIGKDKSIEDLKNDGFKAFFIGAGIQSPKMLDIPGTDLDGVTNAVEYLGAAKPSGGNIDPGKKVVVIWRRRRCPWTALLHPVFLVQKKQ